MKPRSRATCSALLGFLVVLGAFQGCSDDSGAGECEADLSFEGERYSVNTDLSPVPVGSTAGIADEVACDGTTDILGQVEVHAIRGVPTTTAVVVLSRNDPQRITVYLQADLPRDEIPSGWPTPPAP